MKINKLANIVVFVLLLGTSFFWGQWNPSQQFPPSTPPAPQQNPSTAPSQTSGQQTPAGASSSSGAQALRIQDAIRKQLPASADGVVVTTLSDNRIQLSGTASSEQERQQIEQVARFAAGDQVIVNSINVSNPPYPPKGAKGEPPPKSYDEESRLSLINLAA